VGPGGHNVELQGRSAWQPNNDTLCFVSAKSSSGFGTGPLQSPDGLLPSFAADVLSTTYWLNEASALALDLEARFLALPCQESVKSVSKRQLMHIHWPRKSGTVIRHSLYLGYLIEWGSPNINCARLIAMSRTEHLEFIVRPIVHCWTCWTWTIVDTSYNAKMQQLLGVKNWRDQTLGPLLTTPLVTRKDSGMLISIICTVHFVTSKLHIGLRCGPAVSARRHARSKE